jgi:hypothetical protein
LSIGHAVVTNGMDTLLILQPGCIDDDARAGMPPPGREARPEACSWIALGDRAQPLLDGGDGAARPAP